jgi:hypothetical protein
MIGNASIEQCLNPENPLVKVGYWKIWTSRTGEEKRAAFELLFGGVKITVQLRKELQVQNRVGHIEGVAFFTSVGTDERFYEASDKVDALYYQGQRKDKTLQTDDMPTYVFIDPNGSTQGEVNAWYEKWILDFELPNSKKSNPRSI